MDTALFIPGCSNLINSNHGCFVNSSSEVIQEALDIYADKVFGIP
jgi:hypothetical protein